MLGAASMKPQRASYVLHGAVGSKNFQENDHVFTSFCVEAASDEKGKGMYATFERYHEPLLADLYSKREKISLHENDKILMQDADDYDGFCDSSDHNSSHENLLGHERTLLRRGRNKPVKSIGSESISAPLLLTSNELGLTLTPGDSPGDSLAEPSKYGSLMSSRRSSSPSVRFVMPNTPSRQLFNTPIARIESFHSDDFETYTSDYGAFVTARNSSPSPNSIQTPTVPCFQLYSRKKKHMLTSKSKRMNGARDGKQCYQDDKASRKDFRSGDAMMSSDTDYGSDGQVPDGEKLQSSHKARIFPMENSDDQIDGKTKINDKAKVISDIAANQNSSCSRIHQNSNCKSQLWKPNQQEHEAKKSIWHRGFVHLLKKKKQASSRLSGNNNNDIENASRNRQNNSSLNSSPNNTGNNNANCNAANVTNTRNGHTRGVIRAIPPNTLDIQATTVQITWKQPPKHHNNINLPKVAEAGLPDNCPSITHSPSPASKTRVFDYSNVPSHSHKTKYSMLSWKACRACTFSADLSSNEGSDANISDTICNQVGKGESCIIPMTSLKTGTSSVENGNSRT
ncbi:hypothetical protein DPMN_085161 [Dreissena polymorpha]|nr:hypothetical protein DPMN_085161 [Dreissena polymorpha]